MNKKYIIMFLAAMMISTVTGCSSVETNTESTVAKSEEQNHVQESISTEEQGTTEENGEIHLWVNHVDQSVEDYKKDAEGNETVVLTDSDGIVIYQVVYSVDENATIRTEYEYDENGEQTNEVTYSREGNLVYEFAVGKYDNATESSSLTEGNATDTVQYGDTLRVSCKSQEQSGDVATDWKDEGETELVVEASAREFQRGDYVYPYDYVKRNLQEAIGKKVGDTFTLSFEFGDGRVGYEYTVLEIKKEQEADTVYDVLEDGDEFVVLTRERNQEEDTPEDWENIHNAFVEWSVPEEAIGKKVGETYTVWSDDGSGYECLILKIYK